MFHRLLRLLAANKLGKCNADINNEEFIDRVADSFNRNLRFDARHLKMAYTVRDPVPSGIFIM